MEQAGEELDLAPADVQLELPAAVELDPVLGAPVVELEQPRDRPEARRLRVEAPWQERQRLDVRPGVDRRVEGEAVAVRLEYRIGLGRQRGILDPRLREQLCDTCVELRVGGVVDDRPLVVPLQVDDVDAIELGEPSRELLRPFKGRVELEPEPGVELEPVIDLRRARRARAAPGPLRLLDELVAGR